VPYELIPYIAVFVILSINTFFNKKSAKHISAMFFLFLVLFYSFRRNIGSDWPAYEYYFNNVFSPHVVQRYKLETGYWLLNRITNPLLGSFGSLVSVVGITNCFLFWKATNKYSRNTGIVVLLSLFYIFYPTLEAFRQSIPLFIFYYSIQFVKEDSKKFLLLNTFGLLFHRSGIIAFIAFFFIRFRKIRWIILLVLVSFGLVEPYIANIIFRSFPVIAMKYHIYINSSIVPNSIFSLKTLEYMLFFVFYVSLARRGLRTDNETVFMYLILLGLVLQLTLGQSSNIVYRMTYYTDIGIIFGFDSVYRRIQRYEARCLFLLITIAYVALRFYRIFPFDDPRFIYSIL